jgi:hypothetical protein
VEVKQASARSKEKVIADGGMPGGHQNYGAARSSPGRFGLTFVKDFELGIYAVHLLLYFPNCGLKPAPFFLYVVEILASRRF